MGAGRANQRRLLVRGTAGLAGVAAIAVVPTLDSVPAILIGLGVLQAAIGGGRPFAVRLRPVALASGVLALALLFARSDAPDVVHTFAAVGLAAAIAVAIGVVPFLHALDPSERLTSSPMVWLAFVGPVFAAVVMLRVPAVLSVSAGGAFGGILIGLGLLNMVWGGLAAWLTEDAAAAWRYSFVGDWGLALCGLGLLAGDGRRGALLLFFSLILCRLPLYLVAQDAVREKVSTERPINLVVAAALAGSAPFASFAGRILLLRGATSLFWPLALVLAVGMLLWLPGSLRLGRSLGLPRGRRAVGVGAVVALNVIAGLYPLPFLLAAGL